MSTATGLRSLHRKEAIYGWLLTAPAAAHIALWIGLPLVVAFVLGFTKYDVISAPTWIGLDNYIEAFTGESFRRAIFNTFVFTGTSVPISIAIALLVAVLLNQGMRGQTFFRTAIYLPHVTATVAVAVVWLWIYNPLDTGLLNRGLGLIGIDPVSWLTNDATAMGAVIMMSIWQGIGIKMLIFLAALQGLPPEVDEAARIDGASFFQRFWRITFPMLRPAMFFVLITSIISSFQVFDQIYILTQGGPANATTVITYQIYNSAFSAFRMGLASAQSMILFGFLIILAIFSTKLLGGSDAH